MAQSQPWKKMKGFGEDTALLCHRELDVGKASLV